MPALLFLPPRSREVCTTLQIMPAQSKAMAEFCGSIRWNLICGSERLLTALLSKRTLRLWVSIRYFISCLYVEHLVFIIKILSGGYDACFLGQILNPSSFLSLLLSLHFFFFPFVLSLSYRSGIKFCIARAINYVIFLHLNLLHIFHITDREQRLLGNLLLFSIFLILFVNVPGVESCFLGLD